MGQTHHYAARQPFKYRVQQTGAVALLVVMLVLVLLQGVLLTLLPPFMVMMTAILLLLMTAPVLMLLSVSPPVTVHDAGITLHPLIWREQTIAWSAIVAVKRYPLLPTPDQEVMRQVAVGRKQYRAAEGIMLIVSGLPVQYRPAGVFAGAGGKPVIALTSRSHADYDRLVKQVLAHVDETVIHDEILAGDGSHALS